MYNSGNPWRLAHPVPAGLSGRVRRHLGASHLVDIEEAIGDTLTGHAGGGVDRRYGAGFSLAVLAGAVDKLRWSVDLSHLIPAPNNDGARRLRSR